MELRRIVEETDTRAGRAFDWTVQILILISIAAFCVETIRDLPPEIRRALLVVEALTVAAFTVEYALRVYVAERRMRYVLSPLGLLDLAAILPFYLPVAIDLRGLRIFRLLRLVRLLKLLRYMRAMNRLRQALLDIREELVLYLAVTAFVIFLAAVGIYYFESHAQPDAFGSVFHCLWWAVITLSTVGYGDVYPVTVGGRIFTGLLVLAGAGVIAVPSGLLAAALARSAHDEDGATESGTTGGDTTGAGTSGKPPVPPAGPAL